MELQEFKSAVAILPRGEAREVRGRYIGTFVLAGCEECRRIIELSAAYPATTYWGYLWDCLRDPVAVDCQFADSLVGTLGEVLVLWDLHPDGRVLVEDYWKFGRDDVLRLDYGLLLGNLRHLPEDIYIFDRSFSWTLVLTHEYVDDKRWCVASGRVPNPPIR